MGEATEPAVLGARNPRLAELRRLIGRRSSRSAEVVLEGPRTVGEALDAGHVPLTVVVPHGAWSTAAVAAVVDRLPAGVEMLVVRDDAFDRLAPSTTPQPMLAVVPRPTGALPEALAGEDLVLVLVDVADPGNVGTLVRVAAAVAARAVVCVGGADPWGPKAVRASAGTVLRVPVVTAESLAPVVDRLRVAGARIIGTDVGDGQPHDGGVLRGPVAIVLGSEPHGLDRAVVDADAWVRIDMAGAVESLNVAMAGTLLAYEATRA